MWSNEVDVLGEYEVTAVHADPCDVSMSDDDLINIHVKVNYPSWLNNISEDEFDGIMQSLRLAAFDAVKVELDKAEKFFRDRRAKELENQLNIYDFI